MSPIPGVVGAVWCVVWVFMAFSSPQEHPRISEAELSHIERNLPANKEIKVSEREEPEEVTSCSNIFSSTKLSPSTCIIR